MQNALRDETLRKIDDLDASDANYDRAWQILKNAYENKKIIKSNHIHKLMHLSKISKPTVKSLHELADIANKCTEALTSFDESIPSDVLVCIVEDKLDANTLQLWEEQSSHDDFESLEKLTNFLYRLAARLSCRERKENSNSEPPPSKMAKNENKSKPKHKVFLTKERKCIICTDSGHQIYQCKQFLDIPIKDRFKKVQDNKLCYNCLKKHAGACESKYKCKFCHKKHNSLLHRSQENNKSAVVTSKKEDSKDK